MTENPGLDANAVTRPAETTPTSTPTAAPSITAPAPGMPPTSPSPMPPTTEPVAPAAGSTAPLADSAGPGPIPAGTGRPRWWQFLRAPFLSPAGLWSRALLLAAAFWGAHLAGWRERTCILTGTSASGDPNDTWSNLTGVLYFVLFFAWTFAIPIMIIGGGLLAAWFWWRTRAATI